MAKPALRFIVVLSVFCNLSLMALGQCVIDNVLVEPDTCTGQGFSALMDFIPPQGAGQGFDIFVNGTFISTHSYDELPLYVENIPHGIEVFDAVIICDQIISECCYEVSVLSPCICAVYEMEADLLPCNGNGQFGVVLNFTFQNGSEDGFVVGGNGNNYGTYSYGDLPIKITGLDGNPDLIYEFVAVDLTDPFCFDFIETGPIHCSPSDSCTIENLRTDILPCDGENRVEIAINFDYTGSGTHGFAIIGNGNNYGNFGYDELPVILGPFEGDCETIYEFGISDIENPDCRASTHIDSPICCTYSCNIQEIDIADLKCQSTSTYSFLLNFDHESGPNKAFDVYAGDEKLVGSFSYGDLPVNIDSFPTRDLEFEFMRICDQENPDCCKNFEFASMDCDSTSICLLDSLAIGLSECDDGLFDLELALEADIPSGATKFWVYLDGQEIASFNYAALPIHVGPFETDGISDLNFRLVDEDNTTCVLETTLSPDDCTTSSNDEIHLETSMRIHYNSKSGVLRLWMNSGFHDRDRLRIFNLNGQKIWELEVGEFSTELQIEAGQLSAGLYYLQHTGKLFNHAVPFFASGL